MKIEFPILNISPTQWVLVDKNVILRSGDFWLLSTGSGYQIKECFNSNGSQFQDIILAAYPKIEGVLLLPSLLWEPPMIQLSMNHLRSKYKNNYVDLRFKEDTVPDEWIMRLGDYQAGYEAAGGYTREDMRKAFDWGATLQSADETLDEKEFDAFLSELKSLSPRALEIDVNEDGSIPSDNGTIIYNKAIY